MSARSMHCFNTVDVFSKDHKYTSNTTTVVIFTHFYDSTNILIHYNYQYTINTTISTSYNFTLI